LNGTYPNGTTSVLTVRGIPVSGAGSVELSFLVWYDLSLAEDEPSGTGNGPLADVCDISYRLDGGQWNVLDRYNGSSAGSWVRRTYVVDGFSSAEMDLAFELRDFDDGLTDNGLFIDRIEIVGDQLPDDEATVEFYLIPPMTALGRDCLVHVVTASTGQALADGTVIEMTVIPPEGMEMTVLEPIEGLDREVHELVWTPASEGEHEIRLRLLDGSGGIDVVSTRTYVADMLIDETGEDGFRDWDLPAWNGTAFRSRTPSEVRSTSGGKVLAVGPASGGPMGFEGDLYAEASLFVDLTTASEAVLHLYHSYDLGGRSGHSGAFVEAVFGDGYAILEPDGGYDQVLDDLEAGPGSGNPAFSGTGEWSLDSFDLGPQCGSSGYISFVATSGLEGRGEGWAIDDVMIEVLAQAAEDDEPPDTVRGVTVDILAQGSARVVWERSSEPDLSYYRLYLSENPFSDAGPLEPVVEVSILSPRSHILSGLDEDMEYHVAVTAVDRSGNELLEVESVSFRPSLEDENLPPVARIDIRTAGGQVTVGDEVLFSGSGSYDPEGGSVTYRWSLPDGTVTSGRQVRWTPSVAGEARVVLRVTDALGSSNETTLTFEIDEDGSVPIIDQGDILTFFVLIVPITLGLLVFILVIAIFRGRKKRKLETILEEVGIVHRPQYSTGRGDRDGPAEPRMLDLEPVTLVSGRTGSGQDRRTHPGPGPSRRTGDGPASENGRSGHPKHSKDASRHTDQGKRSAPSERREMVNVTLECPGCSRTFRERMDRSSMGKGSVRIKCPHCGEEGEMM